MKKKQEPEDDQGLEILKAVAQAWHGHSSYSSPKNEYDAHRQDFQTRPSRFKLEAMNKSSSKGAASANWDFRQSLLDSYEIVTVAKKLERALMLDDPFTGLAVQSRVHRRRRESKNSLRNLFKSVSSRRFNEAAIPPEDDTQF